MTTPLTRTLLADDSAVVRQAIARRLAGKPFEVLEAEDEAEALAFDPMTLSIVVLDLDLGGADGTATAAQIHAKNPSVRIAFFTSGSTAAILQRAQGFGPVFNKPDDLDALVTWIQKP